MHYRLNIYCLAGSCWEEGSKLLHCDQKQTANYRYSDTYQFASFELQYTKGSGTFVIFVNSYNKENNFKEANCEGGSYIDVYIIVQMEKFQS